MKRAELLLGAVLVAALVLGFVFTRDSGAGDGSGQPAALDVTRADGELSVDGITVAVTAGPRPLRVFDPLRFAFRFTRAGEALPVSAARIDFDMTMDMGPHAYRLVRDGDGAWVAEGVKLPQCGSGSRLWFGALSFEVEGRPHAARLRLELDPPRAD